jgi:hypothetical protein
LFGARGRRTIETSTDDPRMFGRAAQVSTV